jgi:hypothetical protein
MRGTLAVDVHLTVNRNEIKVLKAGTKVPDWADELVTNPAVFAESSSDSGEDSGPGTPAAAAASGTTEGTLDYEKLKKKDIQALAAERGVDSSGTIAVIAARLTEQDTANTAANAPGAADTATGETDGTETAETPATEPVDYWSLPVDRLRALATERGLDVGDSSTDAEFAALLEAADAESDSEE